MNANLQPVGVTGRRVLPVSKKDKVMLCVRVVGQGVPVRMSDKDAQKLVKIGDAEYCPKQFWKDWWAKNGDVRKWGSA